jgi:hypothetical protein
LNEPNQTKVHFANNRFNPLIQWLTFKTVPTTIAATATTTTLIDEVLVLIHTRGNRSKTLTETSSCVAWKLQPHRPLHSTPKIAKDQTLAKVAEADAETATATETATAIAMAKTGKSSSRICLK